MKPSITFHLGLVLIALMLTSRLLLADGVVAETNSGKQVSIEWSGHGAEFQQLLSSAELIVLGADGKVIVSEFFGKSAITKYEAKKLDDSLVEIRLVIQSKTTKIDLKFRGKLTNTDIGPEFEMAALKKALRNSKRKPVKGSLLKVSSSAVNFEFRDVVLGVYGDI